MRGRESGRGERRRVRRKADAAAAEIATNCGSRSDCDGDDGSAATGGTGCSGR
ncbi:unnamed protein product [Citrullus colocynthis]|uniref:Uncharacterized protein n=1 Tax=Citrullus colocynthis TaxID=252529 RepID=A0ABP0YQA4_9ROSI